MYIGVSARQPLHGVKPQVCIEPSERIAAGSSHLIIKVSTRVELWIENNERSGRYIFFHSIQDRIIQMRQTASRGWDS